MIGQTPMPAVRHGIAAILHSGLGQTSLKFLILIGGWKCVNGQVLENQLPRSLFGRTTRTCSTQHSTRVYKKNGLFPAPNIETRACMSWIWSALSEATVPTPTSIHRSALEIHPSPLNSTREHDRDNLTITALPSSSRNGRWPLILTKTP
ncbi:hypothetical protein BDW67DRAFT_162462 [Aspergillus spinulosporus]